MPPKSKPGPAPGTGMGTRRFGAGEAERGGPGREQGGREKVAGSCLQQAERSRQPCSRGSRPANPCPRGPPLWPFRIKRRWVPTPPRAWQKLKGNCRCLPGLDLPAVGTAGPNRCSQVAGDGEMRTGGYRSRCWRYVVSLLTQNSRCTQGLAEG